MVNSGYLNYRWYARKNDIVSGWCVMPIDEPPSLGVSERLQTLRHASVLNISPSYITAGWTKS